MSEQREPTAGDMATLITAVWEQVRPGLRDDLLRDVDARIEAFRRAVYVRENWCCTTMTRFAVDTWCASKPKPSTAEHFGGVTYALRGHVVNYCPFCGVAFVKAESGG